MSLYVPLRQGTQGIHLVSTDEMTGIQALERSAPTQPMRSGKPKLQESEYIRYGTLSLIANWQIAPGGIGHVSIGATRNEFDFANHLANTIIGTI